MGREVKDSEIERFVAQVIVAKSIDFPQVAANMGYNWFVDLEPLLEKADRPLKAKLEAALKSMKYDLFQKLYEVAREGKSRSGKVIEIAYINAMIKYIDSGALLGGKADLGPVETEPSPEEIQERLKRMNLHQEEL